MKEIKFKVKLEGAPASEVAALSAPFDVEKTFGTRARVPVRGTINGFPFRSSLMPMGGCHRMVVMERDEEARTIDPPLPLKKELAKSKAAQANWEKQSFTNKKEMARSITE